MFSSGMAQIELNMLSSTGPVAHLQFGNQQNFPTKALAEGRAGQ